MNYLIIFLGFFFNCGYLLEAAGLPISGISAIYWITLLMLAVAGRLNIARMPRSFVVFVFIFFFYYTLSFIFFPKSQYSYYKYSMVLFKLLPLMTIPFCIADKQKYFFQGYLVSMTLVVFLFFIKTRSAFGGAVPDVNTRLEVEGMNPIWISRIILEVILVAGIVLKLKRKYLIALILVGLPVLYSSGSKGPILALLVAVAFYSFRGIRFSAKTFGYLLLIGALGVAGYVAVGRMDENSYIVQRFFRAVPDASSDEIKELSRVMVWPGTIEKTQESPVLSVLAGNGVGNFYKFYFGRISDDRFYPHNFFLELLVEQGLLFALFVAFSFLYFYRKSKRDFKYLFLFFLVNAMFSGDVILNELVFFYLTFAVAYKSKFDENTVSDTRTLSEPTHHPVTGG